MNSGSTCWDNNIKFKTLKFGRRKKFNILREEKREREGGGRGRGRRGGGEGGGEIDYWVIFQALYNAALIFQHTRCARNLKYLV